MSGAGTYKPTGPFAPQYVTYVYIPSAVLILGAAVVKKEYLPIAIAISAALAGWQFFNNRKICPYHFLADQNTATDRVYRG